MRVPSSVPRGLPEYTWQKFQGRVSRALYEFQALPCEFCPSWQKEGKQTPVNKEGKEAGKKPKRVLVAAWVHAWATASGTYEIGVRGSHPAARPHQTSPRGSLDEEQRSATIPKHVKGYTEVTCTTKASSDSPHVLGREVDSVMTGYQQVRSLRAWLSQAAYLLNTAGHQFLFLKIQLPGLHQLMVEAAEILNIEAPDLYVRQSAVANAYTLAVSGKKPFVVVHTSLVELLTRKELQAVLAHELGHLKCDHGVWLTFANILTLGAYGLGGLIAQSLEEQLFRWLRAAELTCDRAALLVAQDPKVVISVLMKLAGGCPSLADQLNVDEFLEQARSYDKASSSPVGWYIRNAQTRQLSHTLPVLRAREIDEWSRSQEYGTLLRRAIQINTVQKA
ncbi:peptidase family M48 family protein [Actinidia rufa]|uniref:Peptidase family M48 family protein n=1 Tax=Actinidia rufa TaxID=165716 RepID=A0A7J0ELI9_9ERIC|nr:peptidase family M48 family protein [Actinidia rufa]